MPKPSEFVVGCAGFKVARGLVSIELSYAIDTEGNVLIMAIEQFAGIPPRTWRAAWVPLKDAERTANEVCAGVLEYLKGFGPFPFRPVEDLSLDDFVQHIKQRTQNELH